MLRDEYDGRVPDTLQDLLRFPGVGPKMALAIEQKRLGLLTNPILARQYWRWPRDPQVKAVAGRTEGHIGTKWNPLSKSEALTK